VVGGPLIAPCRPPGGGGGERERERERDVILIAQSKPIGTIWHH
jgi:hypothetical protein